jgi:hypothetical protein
LIVDTGSIIYPEPFPLVTPIELRKLNILPFLRGVPQVRLRRLDVVMPYMRPHAIQAQLFKKTTSAFLRKADDD